MQVFSRPLSLWPLTGNTLTQRSVLSECRVRRRRSWLLQRAEIFQKGFDIPCSICMIIIWLTNVKQELVKVGHLQKVIEDEQRLMHSNYSSTANAPLLPPMNQYNNTVIWFRHVPKIQACSHVSATAVCHLPQKPTAARLAARFYALHTSV